MKRYILGADHERLTAEIANLASLSNNELKVRWKAALRNRSAGADEAGFAEICGCIPHAGARARRSQTSYLPPARSRSR